MDVHPADHECQHNYECQVLRILTMGPVVILQEVLTEILRKISTQFTSKFTICIGFLLYQILIQHP